VIRAPEPRTFYARDLEHVRCSVCGRPDAFMPSANARVVRALHREQCGPLSSTGDWLRLFERSAWPEILGVVAVALLGFVFYVVAFAGHR
jgi:hypothetical protein